MLLTDSVDGRLVRVVNVHGDGATGHRLMELGFIQGACVEVLGRAPFGDPLRVRVGEFDLSLRARDASRVVVENP